MRTSAAFVLLQCAGSLGVMSMTLFVSVDLKGDVSDAGLILGLCAGLEIPLMLLFGALAARRSLRRLVLIGAGIGVAYFAVMALTGAVWQVAVAQVLNACSIAAVHGLGISYFQDLMPTQLGRATTMFTNTYRISVMLAGLDLRPGPGRRVPLLVRHRRWLVRGRPRPARTHSTHHAAPAGSRRYGTSGDAPVNSSSCSAGPLVTMGLRRAWDSNPRGRGYRPSGFQVGHPTPDAGPVTCSDRVELPLPAAVSPSCAPIGAAASPSRTRPDWG